MPYEFLDELTVPDIAFRAWGHDVEETFVAAADAVMNAMVEDLEAIQPQDTRILNVEHEALDMLLFNFLQELVYYKDAEQLMLRVGRVRIEEHPGHYRLSGTAHGERLDPHRHRPRVDVKAITLHRFSLQQTERGWEASVILDV